MNPQVYVRPLQSYALTLGGLGGGCIDLDVLDLELVPYKIGEYRISRMVIREGHRGKGQGSQLMTLLCKDADESDVSLVLEASPYNDRTPKGVARLMRFYARCGFEKIKGHPGCMRRLPLNREET